MIVEKYPSRGFLILVLYGHGAWRVAVEGDRTKYKLGGKSRRAIAAIHLPTYPGDNVSIKVESDMPYAIIEPSVHIVASTLSAKPAPMEVLDEGKVLLTQ